MPTIMANIERALDSDDLPLAATLARGARDAGLDDPLIANLIAWELEQAGRFEDALSILREALDRWPDDPPLHLALGIALRGTGQLSAAAKTFDQAIELDRGYAAAWYERGATFEKGGAYADATRDFRQALALEPNHPAAHASVAASHARSGERDNATHHAQTALRLEPGNLTALNALALIAIEEKRFADAAAMLEAVAGRDEDRVELLIGTRTLLGDAYEGLGRLDEAFDAYQRAQALFSAIHAGRETDAREGAIAFAERIVDALAASDPRMWQPVAEMPEGPAATHVFLTGYPRSGTTLVENVLASLPGAIAIEERPTLRAVEQDYLNEADGLSRFASLPEADLNDLRRRYWSKATEAAGEDLTGKLFIDMDPFKGLRVPVIAKLFPHAKVVVMRRDPRDVVWSCFHTNFAYNAGTMVFSTLDGTARHYALTQQVIARSLATLPIDAFELRYEALVRDFDATTQQLCTFLHVPWDEALRRFDRTAARRGVSTASTTQVRRGLYDGSGGWQRYARQLATVEPILAPWIDRLGYR